MGHYRPLPPEGECGRKRAHPMRDVVNAIYYVLRGGIAWRLMPDSFPPWRTVYRRFARLRDGGTWDSISHHLVLRDRERVGR
jgi:putative transposase